MLETTTCLKPAHAHPHPKAQPRQAHEARKLKFMQKQTPFTSKHRFALISSAIALLGSALTISSEAAAASQPRAEIGSGLAAAAKALLATQPTIPARMLPVSIPPIGDGPIVVAPTCPTSIEPSSPGITMARQQLLQPTYQAALAYVDARRNVLGEIRFGGPDFGFVVISFTDDLKPHVAALQKLVPTPAGVIVCPAAFTGGQLQQIANDIMFNTHGEIRTAGVRAGKVEVQLRGDQQARADQLVKKYGSSVAIILGNFPYPNAGSASTPTNGICKVVPKPGLQNRQLRWATTPKKLTVASGNDLQIRVKFTNTGAKPIAYESGDPITGIVTDVGSTVVLANYNGAIAGVGSGGTLRKGGSSTVTALVSTDSCQLDRGYRLTPGKYSVHFVFGGYDFTANGGQKAEQFVSTPIPLTITK